MEISTRFLVQEDAQSYFDLYQVIAIHPSGFARTAEEISFASLEEILKSVLSMGVGIAAVDTTVDKLIGFIMARKMGPAVFDHVLSDLTVGVHPAYQSKGIGRRLFLDFLEQVQRSRPDVLRVELISRESNARAISFYESIGFRSEGVFEKRIRNRDGIFESDIPMAWIRPELNSDFQF